MKSLILGYGVTGKSFESYLKLQNKDFDIIDPKIDNFEFSKISEYSDIYISPGINLRKTFPNKNIDNLNLISDLDIFFQQDNSIKIGITGTNGKSTLCYHLYQLLNKESSCNLIGNIGNPVLGHINNGKKYSVIEISSFQLEKLKSNNLDYAYITNIQRDHIDFHDNFDDYKKIKLKIFDNCKNPINPNIEFISVGQIYKFITGKEIIDNFQFKNLPYRLEKISQGIINDSKSTNTASLNYALNTIKFSNLNLILHGNPNKEKYKKIIINSSVDKVFVYGSQKAEIVKKLDHENIEVFSNLEECIDKIFNENNNPNILFSPGHPSQPDYINFEERGKVFTELIDKKINESR